MNDTYHISETIPKTRKYFLTYPIVQKYAEIFSNIKIYKNENVTDIFFMFLNANISYITLQNTTTKKKIVSKIPDFSRFPFIFILHSFIGNSTKKKPRIRNTNNRNV